MKVTTALEVNTSDKQTQDAHAPKKDPKRFVKPELSDDELAKVSGGTTGKDRIFLDWRWDA